MCCAHCHRPVPPGTERPLWDQVKHCIWVCATCFAFLVSARAQPTPPQQPAPILRLYVSTIVSSNTSTSAGTIITDITENYRP